VVADDSQIIFAKFWTSNSILTSGLVGELDDELAYGLAGPHRKPTVQEQVSMQSQKGTCHCWHSLEFASCASSMRELIDLSLALHK
jgi:hypothetical protein